MDTLPPEIFIHVLDYLPPSTCKAARLTSRCFNDTISKKLFSVLVSFIDPLVAKETLNEISRDLSRRPKSIWSPNCLVPASLPIPEGYLMALWAGLRGSSWRVVDVNENTEDLSDDAGSEELSLTVERLQKGLNRSDLTEEVLREALFRYSLYLSYVREEEKNAPYMQVLGALLSVRNMLMTAGISKW
ncbi:Fc.00g098800.m01.CDS01 [Cosmosporella sp. VM-42]